MLSARTAGRSSLGRVLLNLFVMIALLATMTTPTFAVGGLTGTLSGTLVDDKGANVAGVTVAAVSPSGSYRTTTDSAGRFQIAGVALDTYTVSFEKTGFEPYSLTGVTVIGDQTVGLGNVKIVQSLKTIGRITSRSASSAFQPTATQDTFVFSGQKLEQALGKNFATNQNNLIAASPGTQIDKAGNIAVRGSLATEVGYNYDGIDYRSVSHGGAVNGDTISGATGALNGIGSLSVNPGSGDPSVSNGGAGIVNLIPKRGTLPAFGALDFETGTGSFDHQLGAEYGFSTPNGRFSNYFSFLGRNYDIQRGPQFSSEQGSVVSNYPFTAAQYVNERSYVNNFFYKFGKNNSQSLQFLYQGNFTRSGYKDIPGSLYGTASPLVALVNGFEPDLVAQLPNIGPLYPGQSPGITQAPASSDNNLTNLLKLEYTNNLNASTFLALRLYRTVQTDLSYDPSGQFFSFALTRNPNSDGGSRSGIIGELTKSIGQNNQLTLSTQYELDRSVFGITDPAAGVAVLDGQGVIGRTDWPDFVQPTNRNAPLTFGMGSANPCPIAAGCFLYYLNTTPTINGQANPDFGFFKNGVPRIPGNILASPPNPSQVYGIGLRDQITASSKLHIDAGLRYEGVNFHFPPGIETGNIGPDKETNNPTEIEPKLSVAFNPTSTDAFRASYGRSAIFATPGNLFTPLDFNFYLKNFPHGPLSLPGYAIAGTDFVDAPVPAKCGSGEAGVAVPYRACRSYADLIRWEEDNFFPDNGNARTSTYNNYELSYSHSFKGGYAVKLTPFYRQGYNIAFNGVAAFNTDPVTGAVVPTAFRAFYTGFSKSTGVEFFATTPDRPTGLSGFLSATYVNALSNKPAGSTSEDTQPTVPFAVLAAGNSYRVGFLSPFTANMGLDYKFKNGFRINPVFRYERGFAFGVGNLTPVTLNGVSFNTVSTNNANSVATNDINSGTGSGAINFIDPTNPGNLSKPNIYATRGTPEAPSPGGVLSHPRLTTDLTLEFKANKSTFGVQAENLGNLYVSEPLLNRRYQSIATGVPGALTGQTTAANPANANFNTFAPYGIYNYTNAQNGRGAYLVAPTLKPVTYRLYYQLGL